MTQRLMFFPRWLALILLLPAALALIPLAAAQGMGGGHGGGRGGNHAGTPQQQKPLTPEQAAQPLQILMDEIPQLKLDLLLKPGQIDAWSEMQSALRDGVELEKARARRYTSTSSGTAQPPLLFVQDLADNEHAYAEALADLATKMEKLLGVLDPRQAKTFNDRLQAVVPRESLRDSP